MREVLWLLCREAELDPEWMTEVLMNENITTPRKWSLLTYKDLHELMHHSSINERVIVDVLRMRDWLKKWKDDNKSIKWSQMELQDWTDELAQHEYEDWIDTWADPRQVDSSWHDAGLQIRSVADSKSHQPSQATVVQQQAQQQPQPNADDPQDHKSQASSDSSSSSSSASNPKQPSQRHQPAAQGGDDDDGSSSSDSSSSSSSSDDSDNSSLPTKKIPKHITVNKKSKGTSSVAHTEAHTLKSFAKAAEALTQKAAAIKVSLSDYPTFDGKIENWPTFHLRMKSIKGLVGESAHLRVLTPKAKEKHLKKMKKDKSYRKSVHTFYAVLLAKTGEGTASATINKFLSTEDGCLAWAALYHEKEFGGDKTARTKLLHTALLNVQLHANTNGGLNKYINDFENKVLELDRLTGKPMDELYKVQLFADGIKDDRCEPPLTLHNMESYDFDTLKNKLIQHGTKLKIISGPNARRSQHKKNRRIQKSKRAPKNPNKTNPPKTDDEDPPEGSGLSKDAWNKMSSKNKKWIKVNKDQDKKECGGQYSGTSNKQQKKTSTAADDDDHSTEKKVQFEDPPEDADDKDPAPQSLFRPKAKPKARKKQMYRRLSATDPLVFVPEAPLEGYERNYCGYEEENNIWHSKFPRAADALAATEGDSEWHQLVAASERGEPFLQDVSLPDGLKDIMPTVQTVINKIDWKPADWPAGMEVPPDKIQNDYSFNISDSQNKNNIFWVRSSTMKRDHKVLLWTTMLHHFTLKDIPN